MIQYSTDSQAVDWRQAAEVFLKAPLGREPRDPLRLRRAFESSYAAVYADDNGRLIGLARALCDGEYQAAVYDLVLLPEYQGRRIGRRILTELCKKLPVENIILYAAPGREGFYAKCGFKPMLTAMAKLNHIMSAPESGYLAK